MSIIDAILQDASDAGDMGFSKRAYTFNVVDEWLKGELTGELAVRSYWMRKEDFSRPQRQGDEQAKKLLSSSGFDVFLLVVNADALGLDDKAVSYAASRKLAARTIVVIRSTQRPTSTASVTVRAIVGDPADSLVTELRALPDMAHAMFQPFRAAPPVQPNLVNAPSARFKTTAAPDGPTNTILFGPPGTGKTWGTRRLAVSICGPMGIGPAEIFDRYVELVEAERVWFVTFHPSFAYEDFVEGIRPEVRADGQLEYAPTSGVFKRACEVARQAPNQPFVFIIDEINRANVARTFGELITLLEPDKREGGADQRSTVLPYTRVRFTIPANLHLIGTMNTADRSIATLDLALRRRFEFREVAPDVAIVEEAVGVVDGIDVAAVMRLLNRRIEFLLDRDHLIGHAYFLSVDSLEGLGEVLRDRIVPLVREYFHDDWTRVAAVLGCAFDEAGETANSHPIVRAHQVTSEDLFGPDFGDHEVRVVARLSEGFASAQGESFRPFIEGLLGG